MMPAAAVRNQPALVPRTGVDESQVPPEAMMMRFFEAVGTAPPRRFQHVVSGIQYVLTHTDCATRSTSESALFKIGHRAFGYLGERMQIMAVPSPLAPHSGQGSHHGAPGEAVDIAQAKVQTMRRLFRVQPRRRAGWHPSGDVGGPHRPRAPKAVRSRFPCERRFSASTIRFLRAAATRAGSFFNSSEVIRNGFS